MRLQRILLPVKSEAPDPVGQVLHVLLVRNINILLAFGFKHSQMNHFSDFWDALAPHHSSIENNYLDRSSVRRILHDIHQPVLVVGAGQGLIVEELQKNGLRSDGVDLSSEMIRYARTRRGLTIVKADARAMPFGQGAYQTVIYSTGVIDFIGDEEQIGLILKEARRIVHQSGNIFVAFYRFSAASENFLATLGLLRNNVLSFRKTLEFYRLNPVQTIAWVAKLSETGCLRAVLLSLRSGALSTMQEKKPRSLCREYSGTGTMPAH